MNIFPVADKINYPLNVLLNDSLVVEGETIWTFKEAMTFENETYLEDFLRDNGVCPFCYQKLEPIYENNGFTPPDPTHYEIVGYKPCECEKEGGE